MEALRRVATEAGESCCDCTAAEASREALSPDESMRKQEERESTLLENFDQGADDAERAAQDWQSPSRPATANGNPNHLSVAEFKHVRENTKKPMRFAILVLGPRRRPR